VKAARPHRKIAGLVVARGLAAFFGAFSLLNSIARLLSSAPGQDVWWIDLSLVPGWAAGAFSLCAAVLLLWWAWAPSSGGARRSATAATAAVLALAACANSVGFYQAWRAGSIAPALPLPVSLLIAIGFAWITREALRAHAKTVVRASRSWTIAVAVAMLGVFPLAQMAFFGGTDYRRHADVAVVFGARAYANGVLSTSLEDRVRTAADLYRAGLVPRLIMSGGVDTSAMDETIAMRDRAVALGVPASAIALDNGGANTDASVAGTVPMLERDHAKTALAVSQFYHLPRIKLAYRAAGWDVQTVPATVSRYIDQTPLSMAREVPAFWLYWATSLIASTPRGD
jgi:vancomycin permeability regulator SanA